MYARSTLIEANPERLDALIGFVRDEVQPMVTDFDGCTGMSMLVDRRSGEAVVSTGWETQEAMDASADRVRESRERAAELADAEPRVEEWEIAVMHRGRPTPEGACCRVTWVQMDEGEVVDRLVDVYRDHLLPQIEGYDGFCSASLLVDRVTGRGCSSVAFESRRALEATREQSAKVRETGAAQAGGTISDVREYELVLAHFRVPELA